MGRGLWGSVFSHRFTVVGSRVWGVRTLFLTIEDDRRRKRAGQFVSRYRSERSSPSFFLSIDTPGPLAGARGSYEAVRLGVESLRGRALRRAQGPPFDGLRDRSTADAVRMVLVLVRGLRSLADSPRIRARRSTRPNAETQKRRNAESGRGARGNGKPKMNDGKWGDRAGGAGWGRSG